MPSILVVKNPSTKPPPPPSVFDNQDIEARDETNLMQAEANEPLELLILQSDRPNTITCMGMRCGPAYREALKPLLIKHMDVFAWSHEKMSGIDNKVVEHRLCVDPIVNKVRQKIRTFSIEKCTTISEDGCAFGI